MPCVGEQKSGIMIKDDEARLNLIGAAFDLLSNKPLQKELVAKH
jgi:hypothetical protein